MTATAGVSEHETFDDGSMFRSPIGLLDFQASSIAQSYLDTEAGRYDGGRLIVWDTGCGKSIFGLQMAALMAEDDASGARRHDLTIVIAERGKVSEWVDDVKEFTTLSVRKHLGANRWKQMTKLGMPDVLVTTYDTAKLDLVRFEKAQRGKKVVANKLFEQIEDLEVMWVLDEMGAKLANRTSMTYKAFDWTFKQRRKAHPKTHRAFGLTATPLESGYENAFNLGRLLFPSLMPTVQGFEDAYVTSRHQQFGTPRYNSLAVPQFASLFGPVMDRKSKKDPEIDAQFPRMLKRTSRIDMGPEQAKLYRAIASLQEEDEEPVPGLWGVLRMVADHPAAIPFAARNGDSKLVKALVQTWGEDAFNVPCAKADELVERLKQITAEGHKAVVFTFFGQTVLPVLKAQMVRAGINVWVNHGGMTEAESARERADFRNTPQSGVYLTSDAGCRGINLPEATYLFEYEGSLTFANHEQRINRIHRLSSTAPSVTCTTFLTNDTVEEHILDLMLERKAQTHLLLDDDDGEALMGKQARRDAFLGR